MEWRESDGMRWLEASLPGATAAFTTRSSRHCHGGRSIPSTNPARVHEWQPTAAFPSTSRYSSTSSSVFSHPSPAAEEIIPIAAPRGSMSPASSRSIR